MLDDLNKAAKKVGLSVAPGKKKDLYSVRKVKNGKLVAKNVGSDEVQSLIADRK
ncbi:hypothetical protein ACLQ3C_02295 [Gordonia sp. DT30]|uniref:hypothetical protein n=1 Tax=unclassified Gordonia (in: high G+C Gram-positive bacteria) TaxID=2657482 RepID=UPI003CF765FC